MDLQLTGKRILITGASQGIGAGIAEGFAEERCDLVLVSRSADRLESIANPLRSRFDIQVDVLALDLVDPSSLDCLRAVPPIDVLVNNAGAIPGGDLDAIDAQSWRQAWDLKVFGSIDMCRLFFSKMKQQGGGVIQNNIGVSAEYLDPSYIAGSTGNAGLVAFTRALGARSLDFNIRVAGVSPGPVATDRIAKFFSDRASGREARETNAFDKFPLGRPASVREIADLFVFLASPRSGYISGAVFTVDGGLAARHAV
jgi:NAD(P)-dependent dehydrogenase (short-subunit alcohol dehydrogenase family)